MFFIIEGFVMSQIGRQEYDLSSDKLNYLCSHVSKLITVVFVTKIEHVEPCNPSEICKTIGSLFSLLKFANFSISKFGGSRILPLVEVLALNSR